MQYASVVTPDKQLLRKRALVRSSQSRRASGEGRGRVRLHRLADLSAGTLSPRGSRAPLTLPLSRLPPPRAPLPSASRVRTAPLTRSSMSYNNQCAYCCSPPATLCAAFARQDEGRSSRACAHHWPPPSADPQQPQQAYGNDGKGPQQYGYGGYPQQQGGAAQGYYGPPQGAPYGGQVRQSPCQMRLFRAAVDELSLPPTHPPPLPAPSSVRPPGPLQPPPLVLVPRPHLTTAGASCPPVLLERCAAYSIRASHSRTANSPTDSPGTASSPTARHRP